jgi:hypothetical protein
MNCGFLRRAVRAAIRWKYVVITYRDYARRLDRSVEVESVLRMVAAGKRPSLSAEECRALAQKLGHPPERKGAGNAKM